MVLVMVPVMFMIRVEGGGTALGRFDWFRKKAKPKEEAYYLQYQPTGQKGWVPVERFAYPISIAEAMSYMSQPGVYNLQKRVGGMIAGYAWDEPYVVRGEVSEVATAERGTESDKVASAIENDMLRAVRWFKLPNMIQDAIKKAFAGGDEASGIFGGGGGGLQLPEGKTMDEYLDDLEQKRYERFKKQADRFGYAPKGSVSGEVEPEYEGKFPIWLHPKGIPAIIDGVLGKIDERLTRWGFIGEQKPTKKLLDLPEKPPPTKRLDLKSLRKGSEKKVEKSGGEQSEK